MALPRCGFHAGWPGLLGPAGAVIFDTPEVKESAAGLMVSRLLSRSAPAAGRDVNRSRSDRKGLDRRCREATAQPATGSRSGSDPAAATEEKGTPLHAMNIAHGAAALKGAVRATAANCDLEHVSPYFRRDCGLELMIVHSKLLLMIGSVCESAGRMPVGELS
ncbi:hypothetical protein GCM10009648_16810 [Tsukamurella spumae]